MPCVPGRRDPAWYHHLQNETVTLLDWILWIFPLQSLHSLQTLRCTSCLCCSGPILDCLVRRCHRLRRPRREFTMDSLLGRTHAHGSVCGAGDVHAHVVDILESSPLHSFARMTFQSVAQVCHSSTLPPFHPWFNLPVHPFHPFHPFHTFHSTLFHPFPHRCKTTSFLAARDLSGTPSEFPSPSRGPTSQALWPKGKSAPCVQGVD